MEKPNPDLTEYGQAKGYARGDFLFLEGDAASGFFLVREGMVRVYKMDATGREVEIARLGPGDYFGEAIVFASSVFPAFAQAVKDTSVLYFSRESINRAIDGNPAVARHFLHILARKCVDLNRRIELLGLQSVRQRLAHYLLTRCCGKDKCLVELPVKKTELAQMLGTVSETLSRNLAQLQEDGQIEVDGKNIRIIDCASLRSLI
ncbi:MAG: Crp/Fnr family transcriptional regulator [Acidobacteriota bacterium]